MHDTFSFARLWGLIKKEFTQFKRDRSTFVIVISIPIIQLTLFGFAINTNPKHLPSALLNYDKGPFGRTLVHQLQETDYFKFNYFPKSEKAANQLMAQHKVLFILSIPTDFSRRIVRDEYPAALLEADGTDPVSVAYALSSINGLINNLFQYDLQGPLSSLNPKQGPAELRVHTRYNPSVLTQYNIVPGLVGIILTLSLVALTSMALTRERELGTLESLLTTPLLPVEIIIGKALPFVIVAYSQILLVISIAAFIFKVPIIGSLVLLLILCLPFVLANLFVGITFSTIAKTQLEASQISAFFFLPSFLLSGFAFPFKGMPSWAQFIGNILPLTHFVNITRSIMLKGEGFINVWPDVWPILVFMLIMLFIAVKRFRQTLD